MSGLVAPVLDAPPLQRYGLPELVKGADPGAGAEFSEAVTGSFFVRLLAVSFRLTPDANVADRGVFVEYRDDGDVRTGIAGGAVTVPASDTTDFFFSAWLGVAEWEVNSTVLSPLAPLLLMPGHDWRIGVTNIQAGDTITRVRYWREQFYTSGQPG